MSSVSRHTVQPRIKKNILVCHQRQLSTASPYDTNTATTQHTEPHEQYEPLPPTASRPTRTKALKGLAIFVGSVSLINQCNYCQQAYQDPYCSDCRITVRGPYLGFRHVMRPRTRSRRLGAALRAFLAFSVLKM